jgi:hypothetical protein
MEWVLLSLGVGVEEQVLTCCFRLHRRMRKAATTQSNKMEAGISRVAPRT